ERTAADVFKGKNLLEGAWAKLPKDGKPEPADNSYCYVCHANYQEEELAKSHMAVGVGCELCHGMSDEHSADEDGLTPPEIMWPKEWINVTCMECHPRAALVKQDGHHEFLNEPFPDEVCSDCHGEKHRLKVRTRVWDKKTGKLLQCDGVRMMDAESPAGAAN
ncbi:MAG: cytochrome c3 family protein, partial [Thermoguttaceae bacterium]